MRRIRGMRRDAAKAEIGLDICQRGLVEDPRVRSRMPGQGSIKLIEQAFARHEGLARPALFRRTAVETDSARQLVGFQEFLDRHGGKVRCRAQQVMAATVAIAIGCFRRRLARKGAAFLAQAGQRVVFAQDADDGSALAGLGHERRGNAGRVARDAKAGFFQHRNVQFG
ncbi:hypothetical protein D3C87_1486950 [compost metagenome]